jgi:uncharacterized protein YrrD
MLLRSVHALDGMPIHATDGDIGHVHDLYFDDRDWRVRYVHVDTRHWFGRHVLLAPAVVALVDWDDGRIQVTISREQVRTSPDIERHKPVSRQHHVPLYEYFQWPLSSSDALWEGEELAARLHTLLTEMHLEPATAPAEQNTDDAHLWSARALRHYDVEGDTGDLGRVDDFLLDPDTWSLRFVAVEKGGPLRVNRLLVPVDAVRWINWDAKRVRLTLPAPSGHPVPR